MRRSTRLTRTVVALAGASLVLGACTDTDDSDADQDPGSSQEETDTDTDDEPQEPDDDQDNADDDGTDSDETETPTDDDANGNDTDGNNQLPDPNDGATGPDDGENSGGPEGADPVPDGELPGDGVEMYFSAEGELASVVGVEAGDVLFIRSLPDPAAEEVGRAAPTGAVDLAGRERMVDSGVWAEVQFDVGVGWVNVAYLGYIGDDIENLPEEFDFLSPTADSDSLAEEAAEARTSRLSEDYGPDLQWTIVEEPADTLLYRIDILGMGDDSVRGERLEIHMEEGDDGFEITEARAFPICARGTSDDGLCV